ncbi:LysE family translocator [Aquabacterium humicola]|uniref:LysE family translocator n=1 Tax=Aquabacterium humicola TaxID=3237377 RepID=UPI002543AC98|nr:LysE family translocator [Rubrivivax pictus]
MHDVLILLSLFVIDSLAIVSPGPNILLVVHAAAEQDRRGALLIALGLAAAGALWALIAVSGLTTIFEVLPSLQTAIRIAGAAYLLYIAVRLWRSHSGPPSEVATAPAPPRPARKALLQGLLTSLLNPKSLAYFASIFVLLVPADASPSLRIAAVVLVFVDALLWYGLAAWLFSTPRVIRGYLALRRPIDRACATLMAAFGVKLML